MTSRRDFLKAGLAGFGVFGMSATSWGSDGVESGNGGGTRHPIRIGAPVFCSDEDPDLWAEEACSLGYRAVYAPQVDLSDKDRINAVVSACARRDLVIAEVGRWNNLMDYRPEEAEKNIQRVIEGLALAEELGAKCCVNISGTFAKEPWFGPDPKNMSDEFVDRAIENARRIIDAVHPKRTKFSYEISGWAIPCDPDSYLRLIKGIDREAFGVHLDVCNMINSPTRFWNSTALIHEAFDKLGDKMVSCHAKDLYWEVEKNIHFVECVVGEGEVDITTILKCLAELPTDVPFMIEHMKNEDEFNRSRENIFRLAEENGIVADGRKMVNG